MLKAGNGKVDENTPPGSPLVPQCRRAASWHPASPLCSPMLEVPSYPTLVAAMEHELQQAGGSLSLEALARAPDLDRVYRDAPLRLIPLCQLLPKRFALHQGPAGVQVRLRAIAASPASSSTTTPLASRMLPMVKDDSEAGEQVLCTPAVDTTLFELPEGAGTPDWLLEAETVLNSTPFVSPRSGSRPGSRVGTPRSLSAAGALSPDGLLSPFLTRAAEALANTPFPSPLAQAGVTSAAPTPETAEAALEAAPEAAPEASEAAPEVPEASLVGATAVSPTHARAGSITELSLRRGRHVPWLHLAIAAFCSAMLFGALASSAPSLPDVVGSQVSPIMAEAFQVLLLPSPPPRPTMRMRVSPVGLTPPEFRSPAALALTVYRPQLTFKILPLLPLRPAPSTAVALYTHQPPAGKASVGRALVAAGCILITLVALGSAASAAGFTALFPQQFVAWIRRSWQLVQPPHGHGQPPANAAQIAAAQIAAASRLDREVAGGIPLVNSGQYGTEERYLVSPSKQSGVNITPVRRSRRTSKGGRGGVQVVSPPGQAARPSIEARHVHNA